MPNKTVIAPCTAYSHGRSYPIENPFACPRFPPRQTSGKLPICVLLAAAVAMYLADPCHTIRACAPG